MIGFRAHHVAVPLALASLLAGCASSAASSTSKPPTVRSQPTPSRSEPATATATAVPCPPEGVRFQVGEANAAMGLRVLGITLINCGSRTYRLNGYPAIRPLDSDRAALKVRIMHGIKETIGSAVLRDGPPKPVVLKPGQRAETAVGWRNTYNDIRQPPVMVRFLEIAPLAGRPYHLVDPDSGLDLGSTGRIGVSAWRLLPDSAAPASPASPPALGTPAARNR